MSEKQPQPGTILYVAPGLLSSTAKYLREDWLMGRNWTRGECDSMADKLDLLANELVSPTQPCRQPGYVPDVACALRQLEGIFEACGDGSGTLQSSWVICVVTKALEALNEGIAAPTQQAADSEIDAMVEQMRDLCLSIDELNRPDGFTEAMEIVNKLAALAKSRQAEPAKCPDCGRTKARNAVDAMQEDHCPKWWAIRDEAAADDCKRSAALKQSEPTAMDAEIDERTIEGFLADYHDHGTVTLDNAEVYSIAQEVLRLRAALAKSRRAEPAEFPPQSVIDLIEEHITETREESGLLCLQLKFEIRDTKYLSQHELDHALADIKKITRQQMALDTARQLMRAFNIAKSRK